jgi:biotin carboxylase
MCTDNKNRRILILGAGHQQLKLIAKARSRGAVVIVLDRDRNAPAVSLASQYIECDMLDIKKAIKIAHEYRIDSIATGGSDQVMVTVAAVAKSCQLPCHLTEEAAFRATNKVAMTQAYKKLGVPIGQRIFVKEKFEDNTLEELHYPLVIKPVDAQGQIGTSLIQDHTLLRKSVELALKHSRSKTVAVEEFIEGPEIAAGAWLEKGKLNLIAVTDRVTYNPPPAIGISLQHILPSKTAADAYQNIADILSRVARAYEITDGPLHAQLIMSQDGPRVMEVGCRFGGANEVDLYKHTLGIDILEKTLDLAFGDFHPLNFDFRRDGFQCHGLINLVVAREGVLARHEPLDRYLETGKIVDGGWYKKDGFVQHKIMDAYGRIGWFLVTGNNRNSVLEQAAEVYSQLQVSSVSGENLIFWPDNQYLNLCDR